MAGGSKQIRNCKWIREVLEKNGPMCAGDIYLELTSRSRCPTPNELNNVLAMYPQFIKLGETVRVRGFHLPTNVGFREQPCFFNVPLWGLNEEDIDLFTRGD